MKNIFLFFFLLFSFQVFSQKETVERVDAAEVTHIVFDSDEVYKILITTSSTNQVVIKSRTEGEYFNNISIDAEVRGSTLFLESRFREALADGFDKLGAHKVFVIEVELIIPENLNVEVSSNVASAYIEGDYKNVFIELKNGSCYLQNFSGNAIINTFDGNIEVAAKNISVEAESRHGTLNVPIVAQGVHLLKLKSINGNIKVTETK